MREKELAKIEKLIEQNKIDEAQFEFSDTVSYTHLKMPTILIV